MLNLENVTENSGFSALAPGLYRVSCAAADVQDTKSGDGEFIKCEFDVYPAQGDADAAKLGKVWHNFNTKNKTAKAVEIGLGQLKAFLRVSQFADPNHLTDVNDLVGLSAIVKLKIRKSEEFGDRNEIENFDPKKGVSGAATTPAAASNPFAK